MPGPSFEPMPACSGNPDGDSSGIADVTTPPSCWSNPVKGAGGTAFRNPWAFRLDWQIRLANTGGILFQNLRLDSEVGPRSIFAHFSFHGFRCITRQVSMQSCQIRNSTFIPVESDPRVSSVFLKVLALS